MKLRSMWYYRNMPVRMINHPFTLFSNAEEAAYKLNTSKFMIHKFIVNGVMLYGQYALVYIDMTNNRTIPNYEHSNKRKSNLEENVVFKSLKRKKIK